MVAPLPRRVATSVYRYYDRFDLLLYVGITKRGTTRNHEHNQRAEWWPFVARQEVDHYPTRQEAEAREKSLIIQFRPPFNTQHNPDATDLREIYLTTLAVEAQATPGDAMAVYQGLGRSLPLTWDVGDDKDLVFRTQPRHYPVASRLRFPPMTRVTITGRRTLARRLEVVGPFAIITVRVAGEFSLAATATASLRAANLNPPIFEIRSINLASPRERASG